MKAIKAILRGSFEWIESAFDLAFGPRWNPFNNLGALGFFYYWIVAVSGFYLYIFFDTGTTEAYDSIEYITHDQWYLAGVMRSLHRYASDGMVLFMVVHMLREFPFDRLRVPRWFTWFTGVPILWLVIASGITGYWLVWDQLAQYVAITTSEWLDWLPIFGEPIARNFLSPTHLDDRFLTLVIFIHIAVPLILLFVLWIHLHRVSRPRINPPRGLAIGTMAMMLGLSILAPATSQGPADLGAAPATLGMDWFYLFVYPLIDNVSAGWAWGAVIALSLIIAGLPWLPPYRRPAPAALTLDACHGSERCVSDCPSAAFDMSPRTDGKPFDAQPLVSPDLCVSRGLCS